MTNGESKRFILLRKITLALMLAAAVVSGTVFGWLISAVVNGEELNLIANYRPSTPTRLYDRNGEIFAELYLHRQELVRYHELPPVVIQAFLAIEDDNFFNHFGIDLAGIFRAAVKNMLAGKIAQGGSTLTQQLAKQIYLNKEGERRRTIKQKIRETLLALQIEEELSKEEILELYFNVIYLGHGCQGIACASLLYFEKKAQELTLPEAALLARLPKSPVAYSPFKYPERARKHHLRTLKRLAELQILPENQIETVYNDFWNSYWDAVVVRSPSRSTLSRRLDLAPYFTDYVRQLLEKEERIGNERLYSGGLKVYTTLDLHQQRVAQSEMRQRLIEYSKYTRQYTQDQGSEGVDLALFDIFEDLGMLLPVGKAKINEFDPREQLRKNLEERMLDGAQLLTYLSPINNETAAFESFRKETHTFYANLDLQGAFLSVEPRTGYITTMIGGNNFSPKNQFNRALNARRQPGSSFKIFVYGAALEERLISSESGINDAPFFSIAPDGKTWEPVNYHAGFRGLVSATNALAKSLNICSINTYFKTGPDPIIDLASRLLKIENRKKRFNPDPALALGASEITPMEMATALSIIANDGKDVTPFAIRHVSDQSGNILFDNESQIRRELARKTEEDKIQIIEPGLAYILRRMMTYTTRRGTPREPVTVTGGFTGELASKTGTTSNWTDAWIVGFNPEYATVIWFGFDKYLTMGPMGSGGPMAGPVLGAFYRRIYEEKKLRPPSFRDSSEQAQAPVGVGVGDCGGLRLSPLSVKGKVKQLTEEICVTEENRVYDIRKLLMKEFEVKAEDLGAEKGKLRFKQEEY